MPDKNKIILGTNDDTYIAADDAGNIVLQHEEGQRVALTSTSIEPATDETLDLGSATNKFKDLYLSSDSIFIGNTKLSSDPTTGALSTVVGDEQGQFTAAPSPVGGGGGSKWDWEATGFSYLPSNFYGSAPDFGEGTDEDALFQNIVDMGEAGTNFLDPIALWNHTRGENPLLDPEVHINGSVYSTPNSDNFQYGVGETFRFREIGTLMKPWGLDYGFQMESMHFEFNDPAEFDADDNHDSPHVVTLFKDSENKYFKDFLAKASDNGKYKEFILEIECEVVYTCSDASTAANTPFFSNVPADSDGMFKRTFVKWKMPEIKIRRNDNYGLTSADYNWGNGKYIPQDPNALENWSWDSMAYYNGRASIGIYPTGNEMYSYGAGGQQWESQSHYAGPPPPFTNPLNTQAAHYVMEPAFSSQGGGGPQGRAAYGYPWDSGGIRYSPSISSINWGVSDLTFSDDFFEGGQTTHSDYPQSNSTNYENAGRDAEVHLRVKIK